MLKYNLDLVENAKSLAVILSVLSSLGYVAGYLAMRARAMALGTNPNFELVDEIYVFAGFRFFFITIVLLLLVSPVTFFLRWLAMNLRDNWGGSPGLIDWALMILLALLLFGILWRTFSVNGVVLLPIDQLDPWQQAVLGNRYGRRLALTLLTLIIFVLSIFWFSSRLQSQPKIFDYLLILLLLLQIFLLPTQHGIYFADRRVRVLDAVPQSTATLIPPVAIIDGIGEYVTLLAYNSTGTRRVLTSIKRDDLAGISVKSVNFLNEFLASKPCDSRFGSTDVQQKTSASMNDPLNQENINDDRQSQQQELEKSLLNKMLSKLNLLLEKIGSLSNNDDIAGELWSVEIDDSGKLSQPTQIGSASDLTWPISNGRYIFALQQSRLVLVTDSAIEPYGDPNIEWHKLLGVDKDSIVFGIVYGERGVPNLAALDTKGNLFVASSGEVESRDMGILMQERRDYTNQRILETDRPDSNRGFDIFFSFDGKKQNISNSQGDFCGHPSLATDGSKILFIRQSRY